MESTGLQNSKRLIQIDRFPPYKLFTSFLLFTALLICSPLLPVVIKAVEFFPLINKNYVFLVCNGLLLFIVKNSGLIASSYQETSAMKETHVRNHLKKAPEEGEVRIEKVAETEKPIQELQEVEEKSPVVVKEEEEEEEEEENGEDEVVELISAEELHEKCEDFIRKMKARIRLESQQLVLVQQL